MSQRIGSRNVLFLSSALVAFVILLAAMKSNAIPLIQEGDIIFHKSQSQQSKAIFEATGSEWSHVGIIVKHKGQWYVAEAIQPVTATELQKWINRGKNKEFRVFRNPRFKPDQIQALYQSMEKYMGKNYDIFFEWSSERIYCSEFVYKVFQEVTGLGIGQIQKVKDLRLDGPAVQELIKIRLTEIGRELNLEEEILTPINQMSDPNLVEVKSHCISKSGCSP